MSEHATHDHGHRHDSVGDGGQCVLWALFWVFGFASIEAPSGGGPLSAFRDTALAWGLMHGERMMNTRRALQPETCVYTVRWLPHGGIESRSGWA